MFPLEPYYPFRYIVLMMMVVVLSGRGNIKAATIVSIVIGISETGVRLLLPEIGSFLIYLVLIAIGRMAPGGIVCKERRRMTSFANVKRLENPKVLANSKALANSKNLIRYKVKWIELVIFAAPIAAFFLFPSRLALGTSIIILGLFALSCDLIIGFAGVVTLGQAMYFGIGAYSAALIANTGGPKPSAAPLASAAISAAISAMLGPFLFAVDQAAIVDGDVGLSA